MIKHSEYVFTTVSIWNFRFKNDFDLNPDDFDLKLTFFRCISSVLILPKVVSKVTGVNIFPKNWKLCPYVKNNWKLCPNQISKSNKKSTLLFVFWVEKPLCFKSTDQIKLKVPFRIFKLQFYLYLMMLIPESTRNFAPNSIFWRNYAHTKICA